MSWGRKFFWGVLSLFGLFGLLILFHQSILTAYAQWFVVRNATVGADAIICLSGDRETRTPESLRLWNEGYSPRLFVTAEKPKNKEFNQLELSHLQFAQAVTQRMGLNARWELLPSQSGGATSTFDEAADALEMAKREKWKKIIIVTDEFHTRRSLLAFQKVFADTDIEIQVAGAVNELFASDDWWKSDRGMLAYLGETIKYPVYLLWSHEPRIVNND